MHPLENILGSPDEFLENLFTQLQQKGLKVDSLYMDHICYRVETLDDYQSYQSLLLHHGKLISDKIIGGRPISIIELNEPYFYDNWKIDILELPSPKEGRPYSEGYEHVEFVIDQSLEYFIDHHPHLDFDLKGLDKPLNRDVRVTFGSISVKFHEHPLKDIIAIEQANQSEGS